MREIRLWPGAVAVVVQWLVRFGLPIVAPDLSGYAMLGGVAGGLAVIAWWLFSSRAPGTERWGAALLLAAGFALTPRVLHPSIATGMMGMMFPLFSLPLLSLALVAWAVLTRRVTSGGFRLATMAGAILAAFGSWTLLRTDGIMGDAGSQLAWRWTRTHEEQLLARAEPTPPPPPPAAPPPTSPPATVAKSPAKPAPQQPKITPVPVLWSGFRGAHRDSVIAGSHIETDWTASPPRQLWRRAIGPGWSSFAVRAGAIYTQEQRGDFEITASYRLETGDPVWSHRDAARFWESNAGAGPRGTPALSADGTRLYAFGATGILNALDAGSGMAVWTRNVAADTGAKLPGWGFSSSPVVVVDSGGAPLVVVAASGLVAAYDAATGVKRWVAAGGGGSYSSPHLFTVDGVLQVVMLSGEGAISLAPADGKVLWKHAWPGATILQPAVMPDGEGLLITTGAAMGGGLGTRRLAVARGPNGWTADERWTSTGLKPYFNDLVMHKGHAYGFDGAILSCIDLADGRRKWKGGRYGHGQMLLLADQDLLLVLSEDGELALVKAGPEQFTEIAKVPALEGKTWNHPALAGNTLLVRNGEEMAAFDLAVRSSNP